MPAKYERIRDSIYRSQKRKNLKEAKRIAAATFNKQRKPGQKPVTGSSD